MNIAHRSATTMTSREFNQDTAKAKRAAAKGPVFITDRGRFSHVLLTKEEYDQLEAGMKGPEREFVSLAEALEQKEGGDFDFEIPEFKGSWDLKVPDLD
jgi:prevent-host-death family protein